MSNGNYFKIDDIQNNISISNSEIVSKNFLKFD